MVQNITNILVLWLRVAHGELRLKNGTRALGGGLVGGAGYLSSSSSISVTGGSQRNGGQNGAYTDLSSDRYIYTTPDFGQAGTGTAPPNGSNADGRKWLVRRTVVPFTDMVLQKSLVLVVQDLF